MSNAEREVAAIPDPELVDRIDSVEIEEIAGPVHLLIKVTGSVLRSGYTNPVLVLKSATPDSEHTLTYYFAADPPKQGGTPGITQIQGRRFLFDRQGAERIKVVSATHEMYQRLPSTRSDANEAR
jgi:hypothetical protein